MFVFLKFQPRKLKKKIIFVIGQTCPSEDITVIVVISAGNGGDSFTVENGNLFSTVDQDNDKLPSKSCARTFKSGWWHGRCHQSSLNGLYLNGSDEDPDHYAAGISWYTWLKSYKYFFTKSEMKIKLSS